VNAYSNRFSCNVWLTQHAILAIQKRGLDVSTVLNLIETGDLQEKGNGHYWVHQYLPGRQDNLICAAVVIDQAVVVKTVMVNWQIQENKP
jgi:hypothetical protein